MLYPYFKPNVSFSVSSVIYFHWPLLCPYLFSDPLNDLFFPKYTRLVHTSMTLAHSFLSPYKTLFFFPPDKFLQWQFCYFSETLGITKLSLTCPPQIKMNTSLFGLLQHPAHDSITPVIMLVCSCMSFSL